MTTTTEKHYTVKEVSDLRDEVTRLQFRVEQAEAQNLRNIEALSLLQKKQELEERLVMLNQ